MERLKGSHGPFTLSPASRQSPEFLEGMAAYATLLRTLKILACPYQAWDPAQRSSYLLWHLGWQEAYELNTEPKITDYLTYPEDAAKAKARLSVVK